MTGMREWFSWRLRQTIGMASVFAPGARCADVTSILCIVDGGLGDRLMAIPALRHLRSCFPKARMTVALSGPVPLLASEFDECTDWSGWSVWQKMALCRRRYDLCFVSSIGVYDPLNELLALVTGARTRIGPRYEHVKRTAYTEPYVFGTGGHETVVNARAVGWNGPDAALAYSLRDRCETASAVSRPAPVVLHPGCREGYDHKRWPATSFRALAGMIGDQFEGGALVVGAPSEETAVRQVADGQHNVRARITQGLDELVEVISGAAAFVGNDSGPAHLAASLGTPTVVLMSATLPERCAPVGAHVRVVHEPCELGGCYYVRGAECRGCIGRIRPDHVLSVLTALRSDANVHDGPDSVPVDGAGDAKAG